MNNTVLVCDDAVFMRTMIGDILTEAGLDVVGEASSGKDAVAEDKLLRPDLVTMDIIMPEMGGIEAVKQHHPDMILSDIGMPMVDGPFPGRYVNFNVMADLVRAWRYSLDNLPAARMLPAIASIRAPRPGLSPGSPVSASAKSWKT